MRKVFTLTLAAVTLVVGFWLTLGTPVKAADDPDPPVLSYMYANLVQEAETVTYAVHWTTNEDTAGVVRYGTASGQYTMTASTDQYDRSVILSGLSYERTYYYQLTIKDRVGNETRSTEQNFSIGRKGMHIDSISVRNITATTAEVVANLSRGGYSEVRYGSVSGTLPNYAYGGGRGGSLTPSAKLTNLRPNTTYYFNVIARIGSEYNYIVVIPEDRTATSDERSFTTAKEGTTPTNSSNANTSTPNYVTKTYGCSYSTSTANETTVRVQSQFVKGGETDVYLGKVAAAYQTEWKRAPRCTELQFHLDHATPLDRLTTWLKEQKVTEQFGCKISTEAANEETIRVAKPLTHNNADDKYLESVYAAYQAEWGRYPRCTELQFHLDHATPLERLTAWLKENAPAADVAPTTAPETKKIEFTQSGATVTIQTSTRTFQESDIITFSGTTTPNAIVSLKIASEEPTYATVLSDKDGAWSYTMPGPLAPGEHTVQVSVADKDGKNLGKSDAVGFTIVPAAKAATNSTAAETTTDTGGLLGSSTFWIVLVVAAVIVVLLLFVLRGKKA